MGIVFPYSPPSTGELLETFRRRWLCAARSAPLPLRSAEALNQTMREVGGSVKV